MRKQTITKIISGLILTIFLLTGCNGPIVDLVNKGTTSTTSNLPASTITTSNFPLPTSHFPLRKPYTGEIKLTIDTGLTSPMLERMGLKKKGGFKVLSLNKPKKLRIMGNDGGQDGDGNKGGGNNPGGYDPDNPGKGGDNNGQPNHGDTQKPTLRDNHPDYESYINDDQTCYYDPDKEESLCGLTISPSEGDIEIPDSPIPLGISKVNGEVSEIFLGVFAIKPAEPIQDNLQYILDKYHATVKNQIDDTYIIQVDLNQISIANLEYVLREVNSYIEQPILDAEFSSLNTVKSIKFSFELVFEIFQGRLKEVEIVDFVEPQTVSPSGQVIYDDNQFPIQNNMINTFENNLKISDMWWFTDIGVPQAWLYAPRYNFPKIGIAIIDNGFSTTTSQDTDELILPTDGRNFDVLGLMNNNYNQAGVGWDLYHGEHVRSLIASNFDNKVGAVGVTPNIRTFVLRVPSSSAAIQSALSVARNNPCVKIINISMGHEKTGFSYIFWELGKIFGYDSTDLGITDAVNKGITVVVAAPDKEHLVKKTNQSGSGVIDAFSSNPNVISVGALWDAPPYGIYSGYGSGVDIYTYIYNGGTITIPLVSSHNTDKLETLNGTSAAAPIISGVVALMLTRNPNLTPQEIKNILINKSTLRGSYSTPDGTSYDVKVVNAEEAVKSIPLSEGGDNKAVEFSGYVIQDSSLPPWLELYPTVYSGYRLITDSSSSTAPDASYILRANYPINDGLKNTHTTIAGWRVPWDTNYLEVLQARTTTAPLPNINSIVPDWSYENQGGQFKITGQNLYSPPSYTTKVNLGHVITIPASKNTSKEIEFVLPSPNNLSTGKYNVYVETLAGNSNLLYNVFEVKSLTPPPPPPSADRWYVKVFNIDDLGRVYININNLILSVPYGYESGLVDITGYLTPGVMNNVRFLVWNWSGGYTYGFELWHNGTRTFYDVQGQAGVVGANGNDQTRTNQWIYDHIEYISF